MMTLKENLTRTLSITNICHEIEYNETYMLDKLEQRVVLCVGPNQTFGHAEDLRFKSDIKRVIT